MGLFKKLGIIFVLVVIFFVFIMVTKNSRESLSTAFYVTVPQHTPELDTITLNLEGEVLVMKKVGDREYIREVDTQSYEKGRPLRYGYVRGGFINIFGEDGKYMTLGNVGNRTFVPGIKENEVRDVVSEWKWLPPSPIVEDIQSVAESYPIAPRSEFWAGPMLVDFWNNNFPLQYDSTVDHLKKVGYKWIELAPPWDYVSIDPPVIRGENVTVPSWPEKELREEMRKFKSAGFKILFGPQVCCTKVEFANRSDAWWDAWYTQYDNFLKVHARIAREEGADAFAFSTPQDSIPGSGSAPSFAQQRWERFFDSARESGVPVGFSFHVLPPGDKPSVFWPQEAAAFYSKMDFISLGMWNHLSDKDFPTDKELDTGYERIFADIDYNYNISKKPIVLIVAYFSEIGAAKPKGQEKFPSWEDPEIHRASYDGKMQAMIYESLMKHVADRSFMQGVVPFGYHYADIPLNLDSDIRAKPAEAVLAN